MVPDGEAVDTWWKVGNYVKKNARPYPRNALRKEQADFMEWQETD